MPITLEQVRKVLYGEERREAIVFSDNAENESKGHLSDIICQGQIALFGGDENPRVYYKKDGEVKLLMFKMAMAEMATIGPYVCIYVPQGTYTDFTLSPSDKT
jgi:hypothetical protein